MRELNKKVFFVIGSGRCGTRAFYKMLAGHKKVEIHHEYLCTHVQPLGVLYYMGLKSKEEIVEKLKEIYLSAVLYSDKEIFIDCSHKLTWLIEPLLEIFPQAKFVALVRDGRKVVASFYYKLKDEIYDDESTTKLIKWCLNGAKELPPPSEKKYWWNIPPKNHPFHNAFLSFDRFKRICYHWQESYSEILEKKKLFDERIKLVKLEELIRDKKILKEIFDFMGLPFKDIYFEFWKKPKHVFFPLDFKLTPEQETVFWEMCGEVMERLGYNRKEKQYEVNY